MNSEIENKVNRAPAVKVGGMRVPAADHPVPVVRKEHERKIENKEENNEEERELERIDKLEYDRQTRLAAGERLAKMQQNHPKHEPINSYRQNQNTQVHQPILHTHGKSGAAVQHE
ncbi:hypothetical protein BGX27_003333 [Mortierella sp. AM989]|nr:hypothetical protein BGX27_003333 [Mortierella sp. AM989]